MSEHTQPGNKLGPNKVFSAVPCQISKMGLGLRQVPANVTDKLNLLVGKQFVDYGLGGIRQKTVLVKLPSWAMLLNEIHEHC